MSCHECSYRVPYADTDQMGVVYYANYLEYFERSRTEMLRSVGLPYSELEKLGFYLPVKQAVCQYDASAKYDDLLTLRSWVAEARGAKMIVGSEVCCNGQVLVHGSVTLVCINREHRPVRLPKELLEAVQQLGPDSSVAHPVSEVPISKKPTL